LASLLKLKPWEGERAEAWEGGTERREEDETSKEHDDSNDELVITRLQHIHNANGSEKGGSNMLAHAIQANVALNHEMQLRNSISSATTRDELLKRINDIVTKIIAFTSSTLTSRLVALACDAGSEFIKSEVHNLVSACMIVIDAKLHYAHHSDAGRFVVTEKVARYASHKLNKLKTVIFSRFSDDDAEKVFVALLADALSIADEIALKIMRENSASSNAFYIDGVVRKFETLHLVMSNDQIACTVMKTMRNEEQEVRRRAESAKAKVAELLNAVRLS
jgi:hypothetical protein